MQSNTDMSAIFGDGDVTEAACKDANLIVFTRWRNQWPRTTHMFKTISVLPTSLARTLRLRLSATSAIGLHATDMKAFSVLPLESAFDAREFDAMRTACARDPMMGDTVFCPGQASLLTVLDNSTKTLKNVVHGDCRNVSTSRPIPTKQPLRDSLGNKMEEFAEIETHGLMVVEEGEAVFCDSNTRFRPKKDALLTVGSSPNVALFGRQVKQGSEDFVLYGGIQNWDEHGQQEIKQHSRMFPPSMQFHTSLEDMCNDPSNTVAQSLLHFHPEIQVLMDNIRPHLPHRDLVLVDMHVLFFGKHRFNLHQDRHGDYYGWNLLWTVVTLLSDTESSMHIARAEEEIPYEDEAGKRAGTAVMFPSKMWHSSVEPKEDKADIKIVFFYGLKHKCSRKRRRDDEAMFACSCECE